LERDRRVRSYDYLGKAGLREFFDHHFDRFVDTEALARILEYGDRSKESVFSEISMIVPEQKPSKEFRPPSDPFGLGFIVELRWTVPTLRDRILEQYKKCEDDQKLIRWWRRFMYHHRPQFIDALSRAVQAFSSSHLVGNTQQECFDHSSDYRSVKLREETFSLTTNEARVIEILHREFENGTPEVSQAFILVELELNYGRLRDVFTNREAYKSLVGKGKTRGAVRLNLD